MPWLLPKLKKDFPTISFESTELFSWSPERRVVSYKEADEAGISLLLHELSHGVLDHHDYRRDVELLNMEAAAWDKARELAKEYGLTVDEEVAENNLETYREWLHARSSCPTCEATGFQASRNTYECVACGERWRVNEARLCGLKRYSLNT